MPELPDVQVFKEYADATSLHRVVRDAGVEDGRELRDVSAGTVRSRLEGAELASTRRHGKHLFLELEGADDWLHLHFGMTGS
ncbi:MAG TPA: DNA-formamidopyrimidine glycosylase family protein, partial [Longimicrobiales bacterium]|nr:DNA-formamidopyrimidine glycosylase family protein [Longimicrobiales bacterium]